MTIMRTATAPWTHAQIRTLVFVNVVGALALGGAWGLSSRTASLGGQVRWLNFSIVATLLIAGTDALWLATGRRGVMARRSELLGGQLQPSSGSSSAALDTGLWHLPGTSRVHRGGCQLIAGKAAAEAVQPGTSRARGWQTCEVCLAERARPR